jgi:hypothetical protein
VAFPKGVVRGSPLLADMRPWIGILVGVTRRQQSVDHYAQHTCPSTPGAEQQGPTKAEVCKAQLSARKRASNARARVLVAFQSADLAAVGRSAADFTIVALACTELT